MNDTCDNTLAAVDERPASLPAIANDAASLMSVIARIAENPNIDPARIDQMLNIYERVLNRQAKSEFVAALAEMQPDLPTIDEKGRIEVRAKVNGERTGAIQQSTGYAKLEDIAEGIRPALAKHGFSLRFNIDQLDDGRIKVTGILGHRGGHQEETSIILMHDSTGSKNAVQAMGSSVSYGRRYTTCSLLNIVSRGEDDDGVAGGTEFISEAQFDALNIMADTATADKRKFCEHLRVTSLAELPASRYIEAQRALQDKIRANSAPRTGSGK